MNFVYFHLYFFHTRLDDVFVDFVQPVLLQRGQERLQQLLNAHHRGSIALGQKATQGALPGQRSPHHSHLTRGAGHGRKQVPPRVHQKLLVGLLG